VPSFGLPPSDEPFDFRRQAPDYARWRRDYSPALYDAIAARTGAGGGRRALDVGCGTGFVTQTLRRRGWVAVGLDFSAPMLDQARRLTGPPLVRARGEALPFAAGTVVLLTCGTAFHWLAPAPAVTEMRRVLAVGGWAALFWSYPGAGDVSGRILRDVLAQVGAILPDGPLFSHPPAPFAGSGLATEPPAVIESEMEFTVDEFHGYVATVEYLRRLTGDRHPAFLATLRKELLRRVPHGFRERQHEYLFLARKAGDTDA
jgi:SAM-dependent methyltransferase